MGLWAGAFPSTSYAWWGYSQDLSLYLSSTTTYNSGPSYFRCRSGIPTTGSIETLVWCDGYSFSAQFVTIERVATNSRLVLQEVRVWRGGK